MKKTLFTAILAAILLTGCSPVGGNSNDLSSVSSESSVESTTQSSVESSAQGSSESSNQSSEESSTQSSAESSVPGSSVASESGYTPGDRDINGVYVADGYAAKLEYPLNSANVDYAASRFRFLYDKYLKENCGDIYISVIPDKNYFLADKNGYPALDYAEMTRSLTEQMEYAKYIDIFPMLELSDYYRTDIHWRQERIVDIAEYLAKQMGVTLSAEYTENTIDFDYYGALCRDIEIEISPDKITYLTNQTLQDCKVLNGETNEYIEMYNMELVTDYYAYDMFLSGSRPLLTIENPNAATDKELIIFRDSFACSIVPLLAEGYSKIIMIDIRYLVPAYLDRFVKFDGQDVLFLYSSLVINNSKTLK